MFKTLAIHWFMKRLQEPTTYAGIVTEALLALHYAPPTDLRSALTSGLASLGGLLLIVMREGGFR